MLYIQTLLVIVTQLLDLMLYIIKPKMRRTQLWDIRLEMLSLGLIVLIGYDAKPSANDAVNQIVIGYNATGTEIMRQLLVTLRLPLLSSGDIYNWLF